MKIQRKSWQKQTSSTIAVLLLYFECLLCFKLYGTYKLESEIIQKKKTQHPYHLIKHTAKHCNNKFTVLTCIFNARMKKTILQI